MHQKVGFSSYQTILLKFSLGSLSFSLFREHIIITCVCGRTFHFVSLLHVDRLPVRADHIRDQLLFLQQRRLHLRSDHHTTRSGHDGVVHRHDALRQFHVREVKSIADRFDIPSKHTAALRIVRKKCKISLCCFCLGFCFCFCFFRFIT